MAPTTRKANSKSNRMSRAVSCWYGAMGIGGFAFGLFAERRPFGDDVLLHPLALFAITVGLGLLTLRAASARPVQEIIPERALLLGCLCGLALFLIANWLSVHLLRA